MQMLVALVLATPIFGFALQPPIAPAPVVLITPSWMPTPALELDAGSDLALEPRAAAGRRQALTSTTLGLQIGTATATWVAAVLESIHYGDAYGGHDDLTQTACFTQQAVMSEFCIRDTPWPQTIAEVVSTSLSLTTLAVSSFVPDLGPGHALDPGRAERWRAFSVTRWLGLGMHLVQLLSGVLITNAAGWGWADPERDFGMLNGLHVAHLILSYATAGVDTASALLLF